MFVFFYNNCWDAEFTVAVKRTMLPSGGPSKKKLFYKHHTKSNMSTVFLKVSKINKISCEMDLQISIHPSVSIYFRKIKELARQ